MRAGLLYVLFVIFTLLIVSSEQTGKKQTRGDISSCESIILNKNNDCIVPAISFSLKKPFPELSFFRLINEKLFGNAYNHRIKLSASYLRLYQSKTIDVKPIKQKSFRLKLYYTTEKEDNHNLS